MEEAIRVAQAAFIRAAQSGDAAAMARIFAPDVVLITSGNDTIRGRSVIAESLLAVRPGAEQATFWLARFPPLQNCTDGAYEHGEFTAEIWYTNGNTDTVHTPYVARWGRDSLGNAQIQRAAFAPREIARNLRRGECVDRATLPVLWDRTRARQASSRVSVTLYPFKQPFGGPSRSVEEALNAQGWRDSGYVCPTGRTCFDGRTPATFNRAPVGIVPRLGQLRYRFSRSLAAAVFIGTALRGSAVGLNVADSSELAFEWSGWLAGATLSYQRFGFRAQIGPAWEFSDWQITERAVPYNAVVTYQAHYHNTSAGVVAGGGYSCPVIGPLFIDLYGVVNRFPRTALRGTLHFQPASVANSSYFVGFGFGLAF